MIERLDLGAALVLPFKWRGEGKSTIIEELY